MSDFRISAAFRATMDQLRESGLASIFLALLSALVLVALIVIMSFGLFNGIDMFDAIETGMAGPLGAVAAFIFLMFFGLAYCAAVMAIFRHCVDGFRADFVTSLIYGWKAAFPVVGMMILIYLVLAIIFGFAVFAIIAAMGGFTDDFDILSNLENLSVGLIVLAVIVYFAFFIVLGLFIPARLGLAGPAMAAERRLNPFWALGRSWSMTKGSTLKLMAYLLLISLAWIVIYLFVAIIAGILSAAGFAYAEQLIIYPFTLAYMILYNMVISGIYAQLAGGALVNEEQIDDVFG
jgi:hypothetical protein